MIRVRSQCFKWPHCCLVFIGVPFLLAFSYLAQQQPSAKSSARPSGLRFDGVYKWSSAEDNYWKFLRFYEDGSVVGITTEKSGTLEDLIRSFNKTHNNRGLFTTMDIGIEFSLTSPAGTVEYKGTIQPNGLKLDSLSQITGNKATREYQFIALSEESLKKEAEAKTEQKSFIELKVKGSAAETIAVKVSLGQGRYEADKCFFTPFEGPAKYPPGTNAIAYQVTIEPPTEYSLGVNVRINTNCGSTVSDRCNDYAIINGRAVNNKWTTFLSCDKGERFVPGIYNLQALLDETIVEQISFEIK